MPEKKTLAAKLSEVMGEMGHVPKNGFNRAQNYRFAREADVAEMASKLLAERHVFLHQSVVSQKMEELYKTQSGNMMFLTTVEVDFTWHDGDTGDVLPAARFVGTGADTGDKGIYKALTGAEKYFLMKTFLVSTGDDPEGDEKVDKAVAAAGAAAGTRIAKGKGEAVGKGGKSDGITTAQVAEIARLAKEAGLDADTVIPVITRATGKPEPDEGVGIREWLASMTGAEAGRVIAALSTAEVPPVPDPSTEDDADDEQTDLPLV